MAARYQVNINITAGTAFSQQFILANPDMSPVNITGYKFVAKLAKSTASLDAMKSTSDKTVHKTVDFICNVINGPQGKYDIYLPTRTTEKLKEGKYVYSVLALDRGGQQQEVVSGLAFVERSVAALDTEYIYDGGSSTGKDETIIDGGGARGF